jgi:alpha-glucosidase
MISCNRLAVRLRAMAVLAAAGVCILEEVAVAADNVIVKSPDGRLTMQVEVDGTGQLTYRLSHGDAAIIEPSPLGLTVDGTTLGRGVLLGEPKQWDADETYSCRGVHSKARNHFNGAMIPVTHSQSEVEYISTPRELHDLGSDEYEEL